MLIARIQIHSKLWKCMQSNTKRLYIRPQYTTISHCATHVASLFVHSFCACEDAHPHDACTRESGYLHGGKNCFYYKFVHIRILYWPYHLYFCLTKWSQLSLFFLCCRGHQLDLKKPVSCVKITCLCKMNAVVFFIC